MKDAVYGILSNSMFKNKKYPSYKKDFNFLQFNFNQI